jgi:hypothetical protein
MHSGEDLDNHGAAVVERFLKKPFLKVERFKARLGGVDIGFDVADLRSGVDELQIEFAAIRAQRPDLAAQLGLGFHRIALPRARGLEFLVACFECVWANRRGCRSRRWRRSLDGRGLSRRGLRESGRICSEIGAKRQHEYQSRTKHGGTEHIRTEHIRTEHIPTEHLARIGSARPSENHQVQGRRKPHEGKV